jgi:uncharacterized membrane protein
MSAASGAEAVWYLAREGRQYGPLSDSELGKLVELNYLLRDDYLWRDGYPDWIKAGHIPGLLPQAAPPPPPPPPPRSAPSFAPAAPAPMAALARLPAATEAVAAAPVASPAPGDLAPTGLPMAAYICLLIPIPPLPLIGFIIALVNMGAKPDWLATHYRWQVKTVVIQIVLIVIGLVTSFIGIGILILLGAILWGIVRHIRGLSRLNRREPAP